MTALTEQMEASFLSMELLETDDYLDSNLEENLSLLNSVVYDYRSINLDEVESFLSSNSVTKKINVFPNHKIEKIANDQYSDKNYWDLILLLNNREMITEMPKNSDLLQETVETEVSEYFANPNRKYQGNAPSELIEAYKEALLEKRTEENLEKQLFEILDPNYKKQFLRSVKYKV